MEKAIHWIIDHLPKPLQKLWYDHESVWIYILMGGLTTVVSLVFQMLPTALFNTMHMANWLNTGLSTTISWIFAVTFAFFTNKKYVFKSETHTRAAFWREFYMFYGARLVTYFLELAIMELGNHFFATVNGEIVIALIGDEATCKRYSRKNGHVWLMPENDAYAPIDGTYAQILGKVVAVVRQY